MQKTTGEFKTKEKLHQFIGSKGYLNFISNEATIDGKQLSGLGLDDLKFKMTIYEDETVDFEDIENQSTTVEFRKNLLDVIFEKTITPFRKKMVISELTFTSVQDFEGKKVPLYLSVDYKKPIEKLASIFDDEEVEVTDEQMNKLDDLLSIFGDEVKEVEEVEDEEDKVTEEIEVEKVTFDVNSKLEESFKKMKEEKVENLKKELEKQKVNLDKFERDKKFAESKIEESKSEIRLLESRIESLQPELVPNGMYFNISERLNEKIVLEKEIYDIIKSKVDKVKGINSEAFMKLFQDGEFQIRFAKKTENGFEELVDLKELDSMHLPDLTFTIKDNKLYYIGEIVWADLVNKFLKMGFSQDPDWDKLCNSNSYKLSAEVN